MSGTTSCLPHDIRGNEYSASLRHEGSRLRGLCNHFATGNHGICGERKQQRPPRALTRQARQMMQVWYRMQVRLTLGFLAWTRTVPTQQLQTR